MKFLADENIPLEAVNRIQRDGIDILSLSTADFRDFGKITKL